MDIPIFAIWSQAWATRDLRAGSWVEDSLERSTCRVFTNSTDFKSEVNWLAWHSMGVWGLNALKRPHISCQSKTQTHSPLWFGSSGDAPKGPGTVLSYLYFQSSWQNQAVYPLHCTRWYLVLALPPTCHASWATHLQFSHLDRGYILHGFLNRFIVFLQLLSRVHLFATPWTPGFSVLHCLPELAQTHVHSVSDAMQLSHPLSSPSPPAFNQSFPASGSFPVNQFFVSGGHSIGASASALAFPMNI